MKNTMRIIQASATALLILATFSAAAAEQKVQAVTPVPVPKDMLDGTRLVLKAAGCSLDLPGPAWSWMVIQKAEPMFICLNAKTFDMVVITPGQLKVEMKAHQPDSLVKNERLTTEGRGGKLIADKVEMIELPNAKKGAHVTFQELLKGSTKYAYIYLAQMDNNMLLQISVTAPGKPAEPDELKKVANSIKLLTPAAAEKK